MTEATVAVPATSSKTGKVQTINELFREAAARGDRPALRRKVGAGWETISWKGYRDAARRIGNGLVHLGLVKDERVAILSNSRVEWCFCDLGISGAAGCVVPIYQNVKDDEVGYVLHDSGSRFAFVEDLDQLQKVLLARKRPELGGLPRLEKVIVFDVADTAQAKRSAVWDDKLALTLDELLEKGEAVPVATFDERSAQVGIDDLVTLVYTSGTTGVPKGVMLTHGNALGEVEAIDTALELLQDDVVLSFLPLAHIFARAIHWCALKAGYTTVYTSIARAAEDMKDVCPTCVPSVPRFFEKIYAGVMGKVEEERGLKKRYVKAALSWAREGDRCERERRSKGLALSLLCALGKPAVGKISGRLKERTGGRIRVFVSGGAPLSRDVAEFFHTLGFLILEGYGLTETTAATHVNRMKAYKLGTVGPAVPGVECVIAGDGEILVKGPPVMKGYYNKPEATAEVFDEKGFFKTGDIGEIDAEGFLRITDRKKDLLKTAGGKYVAPQKIENALKTVFGISQAVLIGDARPYCTALLTIDPDAAKKLVADAGRTPSDKLEELAKDGTVLEHVERAIAAQNATLPSWETIKYFRILPRDFEIGDELTPTLKVKRKRVAEKYATFITELYKNKAPGKD